MASGAKKSFRGSFLGTGASLDIKIVGFRPSKVHIWGTTGVEAYWQDTMADAAAFKRLANGTGSSIASQGVTPLANGFNVGTDAACNASGVVMHYEAID